MREGNGDDDGIAAANEERIDVYRNGPERKMVRVALSKEELVYMVAHNPIRLISAYETNKLRVDAWVDMMVIW
jgi:hypothetical protein